MLWGACDVFVSDAALLMSGTCPMRLQHMGCLVMVQHQDIQLEDDDRDAVVGNGVFEPQDTGDAVSTEKAERLVADREAIDGHGGAELLRKSL